MTSWRRAAWMLGLLTGVGCSSASSRTSPVEATRTAIADGGANDANATSISVSPLVLTPRFDPAIHDYYVACASGENALTVSMRAASGGTIGLLRPHSTQPLREEAVAVTVEPNDAIVVGLSAEGATSSYWIRCLPADFPGLVLTRHPEAGSVTPGYYLLGPVLTSAGLGYAIVMDANGVPVWYHTAEGGLDAVDVENLTPGVISYVPYVEYTFGKTTTRFELHDLLTSRTSYVESAGIPLDLHELRVLSNGNYLVIANPIETDVDLTGLDSLGAHENMVECILQEVTPRGTVAWSWNANDHFDPALDSTLPVLGSANGKPFVDPFHCNSIDVSHIGDLLVSSRGMDSVFLVSRSTGAVLWKMGGSTYTKEGAPYVRVTNDPETSFYRQHDARFQASGTLSMFDDHTSEPGPARAVVYAYDVAAGTASPVWQYEGATSSTEMGSFRISADGSRVIGWGFGGAPSRSFTEVDGQGHDLLDFAFSPDDATYRVVKVPLGAFDIATLRASVGR